MQDSTASIAPRPAPGRGRAARLPLLAALLALALLPALAGCGGSEPAASPPPDYEQKLADAPAPLAALYSRGNELVKGGKDAFEAQLGELEGFPAVVNVWASWCGPCRAEFPDFQELSAELGTRVAFLGVNSEDEDDLARSFLEDFPVPYPSFSDNDREISRSLGSAKALPATAFFDAQGNQTYLKQGQYPDRESLEADIRTYAIEGQPG